jgi:phosphate/sulfate permease
VVTKKSSVTDVRSVTLIDLTYGSILFIFQFMSKVPMSTTWVFLGLLAGREIAMTISTHYNSTRRFAFTFALIRNDVVNALIGLFISIVVAILVNEGIQQELLSYFQ